MSNTHPQPERPRSRLDRWKTTYGDVAVVLLSTVLLLVLVNLLLLPFLAILDRKASAFGPGSKYSEEKLASVYPDLTPAARELLLRETWVRPYVYDDYVMIRERPIRGTYVNVSEAGFRHGREQGPWPPRSENLNVFVFGGSTTFGYGVPDAQTVPSLLQETLARRVARPVCVYNFGVGFYYSTQERILFEKLLSNDFRPDLAIFIDGVNDSEFVDDRPIFSDAFRSVVDERGSLGRWRRRIPLLRAASLVADRMASRAADNTLDWTAPTNRTRLQHAVQKYRRNIVLVEGVCKQFGVAPIMVWQPAPGYQYDLKYHLFADEPRFKRQAFLYAEMEASLARQPPSSGFVWCADLQREAKECLYVDSVHYTEKFCRQFAEAIVTRCAEKGLLKTWMKK